MKILLMALFLMACSSAHTNSKQEASTETSGLNNTEYTIKPGEVIAIKYSSAGLESSEHKIFCKDRWIKSFVHEKVAQAYVSETYFSDMKPFECYYELNGKKVTVAQIKVAKKKFPSEKLKVDMKRVVLSKKDQSRVDKEQVFLNSVYVNSPGEPLFKHAFAEPLNSKVTSIYGTKRLFNNHKQTQHLGIDYRAAVGVPIYAANAGKVVVARDLFYTGYTITIDHGVDIFSIYGHLSKVLVKEGEYVPKGGMIGYAGMSGRVTGPHLHWGVKVNGHFIEGTSLVSATSVSQDDKGKKVQYQLGSTF